MVFHAGDDSFDIAFSLGKINDCGLRLGELAL